MAKARITAAGRIQRLLAMLQWAARHPDGVPLAELRERFGIGDGELQRELTLAMMIDGDQPDASQMPFEVYLEGDSAFVHLREFRSGMRLTALEGLALLAAADLLVDRERSGSGSIDEPGPLERALAKIAGQLGVEPGEGVELDLDIDGGPDGRVLREAIAARNQVGFEYWSYGRDAVASRVVDPWGLASRDGSWYLLGWDRDADQQRTFKLDRMVGLRDLGLAVAKPRPKGFDPAVEFEPKGPEVVLDLAPEAWWVAEAHPVRQAERRQDGTMRVTFAVSGPSWLERLLLNLGRSAEVVAIDPAIGDEGLARSAALRVLARYGRAGATATAR